MFRQIVALPWFAIILLLLPVTYAMTSATPKTPREEVKMGTDGLSAGVSPLLAAVGAADLERVRMLLQHGANPNDPGIGRSPLIQAITLRRDHVLYCSLPIVRLLLKYGADPKRADVQTGAVPLLTAFAIGDAECALALRDAGAAADSRDSGGQTIIHSAVEAAARSGNMSIIDLALSWGADVNGRSNAGFTALHVAVWIRSLNVVNALLDRGANPCIKSGFDQTPLEMAVDLHRDQRMIDALRKKTLCH